jgi:GNAT superfamily N-acetyltransferase
MTNASLGKLVAEHFGACVYQFGADSLIATPFRGGGFQGSYSDIDHPFGSVFGPQPGATTLDTAPCAGLIKSRGKPAAWLVGEGPAATVIGEELAGVGFIRVDPLAAMTVELASLVEPPMPEEFTVRLVSELDDWASLVTVAEQVYGLPRGSGRLFDFFFGRDVAALGLYRGDPVACSMTYVVDGVAGLYTVGVLPGHRGKGFGAAVSSVPMLWHRDAGRKLGVLQASAMGRPVYHRLGWNDCGTCPMYVYLLT